MSSQNYRRTSREGHPLVLFFFAPTCGEPLSSAWRACVETPGEGGLLTHEDCMT